MKYLKIGWKVFTTLRKRKMEFDTYQKIPVTIAGETVIIQRKEPEL